MAKKTTKTTKSPTLVTLLLLRCSTPTVWERVDWYSESSDRTEGTVYAKEGLAHISIDKYAGKPRLTAEYIYGSRRYWLTCVRMRPFTKLGSTRTVKRWMRKIFQKENDLVGK